MMSLPVVGTAMSPNVKLCILTLSDGFTSNAVKLSSLVALAIVLFPCKVI